MSIYVGDKLLADISKVKSVGGEEGDVSLKTINNESIVGTGNISVGGNVQEFKSTTTGWIAQAFAWYDAGNIPQLLVENKTYVFLKAETIGNAEYLRFQADEDYNDNASNSIIKFSSYSLKREGSNFSGQGSSANIGFLKVGGADYSTPYIPQYPGNPATKKYVDDKTVSSSATAPTNPTAGQLWYDVTNKILKVYNGTAWEDISGDGVGDMQKSVYDPNNVGANAFDYDNFINTPTLGTASEKDTGVAAGNVPVLDSNGKLNASTLPGLALTDTFTVTNASDLTGLTNAQKGDLGIVTSESKTYVLSADPYSTATNWKELLTPTDAVSSVNGKTGAVTLNADDINDSTTTNKFVTETEKDTWNDKQDELTAGNNIQITGTTISATDTTYTAGEGIEIKNGKDYSAMRGPCTEGFHVPRFDVRLNEIQNLVNIMSDIGISQEQGNSYSEYLKIPFAGQRFVQNAEYQDMSQANFWSCSSSGISGQSGKIFIVSHTGVDVTKVSVNGNGKNIRPFKDVPVTPDNTWTKLYGTDTAGIFHNATLGLISIVNGDNIITIADKNLGATQVYNFGDTLTNANCGNYYQRGNNYGFPGLETPASEITTSPTQVDATGYGPGNYYSSSTFITNNNWQSSNNSNLRGGVTGVVEHNNAITNTGVLSVNGQTGDVVVDVSNTKTFYLSDYYDLTTAQSAYDWIASGNNAIIVYEDETYIYDSDDGNGLLLFRRIGKLGHYNQPSYTQTNEVFLKINYNNGVVTLISPRTFYTNGAKFLSPQVDYETPYTPQYDGSPATKKYVDDAIAGAGGISGNVNISDIGPNGLYYTTGATTLTSQGNNSLSFPKGTLLIINEGDGTNRQVTSFGYVDGTEEVPDIHCWIVDGTTGVFDESVSFLMTEIDPDNFLSKYKNVAYTPTDPYNPATKKYVDDTVASSTGIQLLPGSPVTKKYEWIGSEAEYQALGTYRTDTEYKIY